MFYVLEGDCLCTKEYLHQGNQVLRNLNKIENIVSGVACFHNGESGRK